MQTKQTAWNCEHCKATNVVSTCGCAASKGAAFIGPQISVDQIALVIPARKRTVLK